MMIYIYDHLPIKISTFVKFNWIHYEFGLLNFTHFVNLALRSDLSLFKSVYFLNNIKLILSNKNNKFLYCFPSQSHKQ